MLKPIMTAVLAVCITSPALAQATNQQSPDRPPAAMSTTPMSGAPTSGGYNAPMPRMTMPALSGAMRTSRIVGASVYNDRNEKLGEISDLLIGQDRQMAAVIATGGFLGVGARTVQVPFERLQLNPGQLNGEHRVTMPGMSQEAINAMPEYQDAGRG